MRYVRVYIASLLMAAVFYATRFIFSALLTFLKVGSADVIAIVIAIIAVIAASIYYINWNMNR